ncbi:pyridoxal-phosphate dependent enzyme [Ovoidimarina sediminis]|uniref:pyridoxal-phosphate dependent enzyme n=1 Tax=Ovoidimarina sediminis TaxID=3079856 RepID=UPI00290C73D4|nr:pyridoxal-phosphate dependent enzyme [Rhodophyticola sp. MJ-SS7]MDU8942193.1 pyridoxal-phosphate dependent enzyme [Rhodophyticola sp. MJ-SS7]
METLKNPHRGIGLNHANLTAAPDPSVADQNVLSLLSRCPRAGVTPLVESDFLAAKAGVGRFFLKDERERMGLGSFKALGAAYVIACDHEAGQAEGRTYIAASAGNHGLSVAAGAAAFKARAIIYLSEQVPEAFATRLKAQGAEVVRSGSSYAESMEAAARAAAEQGAVLLSDSSWEGYFEIPHRLMEGYLAMMAEVFEAIDKPPTHLFLQAGVGGLAGAAAAAARAAWGDETCIIVVEPEVAPALLASIKVGRPVLADGPVSAMGRLDCKEPSLIALKGLARDADFFMTITEEEGAAGAKIAASAGLQSTPSGAAGLSGAIVAAQSAAIPQLDTAARVLSILSEGPEA